MAEIRGVADREANRRQDPLLSINDLRVVFTSHNGADSVAVHGLSAELVPGGSLAVVGESGSGKTVSMRALLGLLPGTAHVTGSARFAGRELIGMNETELRQTSGRDIGMVFQNAMQAFNPTLTLKRQLTEHLLWHGICGRREAVSRAIDALDRVGIPDPKRRINAYPFQLSGGMLQRAMIAMAVVAGPQLLIADEPTTAVDVTLQRQVLDLLGGLRDDGLALIMITHDLGVARYSCEDVLVMRRGAVVETGRMANFASSATHEYSRRLLNAALEVDTEDQARVDDQAVETSDPELLLATGLSKVFNGAAGEVTAVDSVSVSIARGEAVGLVGESGSGKSTLARLLLRLAEPSTGAITYESTDLITANRKTMKQVRRSVQMIFQNPYGSLLPHRTVAENVAEPLAVHRIGNKSERRRKALALLERVGIPTERVDHYPRQFSGGQQQRIAIARALVLDPQLLVCDEPTSALDVSIQAEVLALLAELRAELGLSMIFITHNLAVAQQVCDRIIVMARGHVVEAAPANRLFGHPQHRYTQALVAAVLPVRNDPLPWASSDDVDVASGELIEVEPRHWVRTASRPSTRSGTDMSVVPASTKE